MRELPVLDQPAAPACCAPLAAEVPSAADAATLEALRSALAAR